MGFKASKKQMAACLKQNGGDISGEWNLRAHEMQTGVWSATLATALRSDQNNCISWDTEGHSDAIWQC